MKPRNKLITTKELKEFKNQFMDDSILEDSLMLSFDDAKVLLKKAKEQQIPISGHDYYILEENNQVYPKYEMLEKYVDQTQPDWIDQFIDGLFESIECFSKKLAQEDLYIEFTIGCSSCDRANSTPVIDEKIRLTDSERGCLDDSSGDVWYFSQYVDHPTEGEMIHFKSDQGHEFYYNPFTRMVLEDGVYKPLEFGIRKRFVKP